MNRATPWRIRVGSHVGEALARWLDLRRVANRTDGQAELTTRPLDQSGLHGLLARIRDLNLTLLAVEQTAEENDE